MLFEKLTDTDKNIIYNYICDYGPMPGSRIYRQNASLEHLLRFWNSDKEWLYNVMGGNFTLEKSITYKKSLQKIRSELSDAMVYSRPMGPFKREYFNKMGIIFETCDYKMWDVINHLVSCTALSENSMEHCSYLPMTLEFEEGKKVRIEKTTKPMRALGKIAKYIGEVDKFETFRLEHSRILNQKEVTGTLCLSIHPMDFLTMSDNESNWTSCMSWAHQGGYRLGVVEMLNSSWVVVAYLKHSDEMTKYGWNNKYWRSLFVVQPSLICSIKGYPYNCDNLTQECVNWLRELIGNYCEEFTEPFKIEPECTCKAPNGHYYNLELRTNVMYPDYESMEYLWGCVPKTAPSESSTKEDPFYLSINYSGITECMCCGDDMYGEYPYEECYVYCEDCCSYADDESERQCEQCGCWYDYDDLCFCEDDYYCCDCIDEVGARDVLTYDYYYYENLSKVYLAREDNIPNIDNDDFVYMSDYHITITRSLMDWWGDYVNVPRPSRTEDGIYYFNRADLKPRAFANWYELYDADIERYFNQI